MKYLSRLLILVGVVVAIPIAAHSAPNVNFTVLQPFSPGVGSNPQGGLLLASDGNYYGNSVSSVYKLTPAGDVTVLSSFGNSALGGVGTLIQGSDGSLYGVTAGGGTGKEGTVFKVTLSGTLTILHNFPKRNDSGVNVGGANPEAGLIQGTDGNFYGTTSIGGSNTVGTVFKITTSGTFTTIHTFSPVNGRTNSDGAVPNCALIQSGGQFYGTTSRGGADGGGTIFKISPTKAFTTLYNFSMLSNSGTNADGADPEAGLLKASNGNYYGTTVLGGASGSGTIFKLTPSGSLTAIHSFAPRTNSQNSDGLDAAALIQGDDGYLYGTAMAGGMYDSGTLYRISVGGLFQLLYTFVNGSPQRGGIVDGGSPNSPLIEVGDGKFYGTTQIYNGTNLGELFELDVTNP